MTSLDRKSAFFHLINDHRWLSAAGCAWNLVGPEAIGNVGKQADDLLSNVGVMVMDSLLLHARSLIKFYRNAKGRHDTDIILSDFGVKSVSARLSRELQKFENPIEVHLLHLTDWRDSDYRSHNTSEAGATRGRPDWNHEATLIVESLLEALDYASQQAGDWSQPFKELYRASGERYRNKSFSWPANLSEKEDVKQYLQSLGL